MNTALLDPPTTDSPVDQTAVRHAVDTLLHAELDCAERDDLTELMRAAQRVRGFVDAFTVRLAHRGRELERRDRPHTPPTPDPPGRATAPDDRGRNEANLAGLLMSSGMQSSRDARDTTARSAACTQFPTLETALAHGHISTGHIDALARHLHRLTDTEIAELRNDEPEILRIATHEYVEAFDRWLHNKIRQIRDRHRPTAEADELAQQRKASHITTYTERGTGMRITKIALDPLRDQQWTLAWKAHIKRLRNHPDYRRLNWQQLEIEAFLAAITSPAVPTSGQHDASRANRSATPPRPTDEATRPSRNGPPPPPTGNRPQPTTAPDDSPPDAEHADGDPPAPSTSAADGPGTPLHTDADQPTTGTPTDDPPRDPHHADPDADRTPNNTAAPDPERTRSTDLSATAPAPPSDGTTEHHDEPADVDVATPNADATETATYAETIAKPSAAPSNDAGRTLPVVSRVPKMLIIADLRTLITGPHERTIAELSDGTPVPLDLIRELLPHSDLVPILISGKGQPLWVGRTRRLATEAQRDALTALYRTCARPSCDQPVDNTQAHHTTNWEHHGVTNIDELAPLCTRDHDAIHHGGHRLHITNNHETLTWYRNDGTIESTTHGGNRTPPGTG